MEAFLFIVTIPREEYEKELKLAAKYEEALLTQDKLVSYNVECEVNREDKDCDDKTTDVRQSGDNIGVQKDSETYESDIIIDVAEPKREDASKDLQKKSLKNYLSGLKKAGEGKSDGGGSPKLRKMDLEENETENEISMEKMVEQTLFGLDVLGAAWSPCPQGTHVQVSFGVQGGVRCERTLHALRACGVGSRACSSINVLPCALHYSSPCIGNKAKIGKTQEIKDSAWSTFVRSVRSRLTVAQVAEQVRAGAALTFDFFFLLMVAALTAAIGLAENSTVFLVASMLISPLMGPIVAGTFGTAVKDRDLQRMGVIHEIVGLLVAMGVGFVFGLVICGINENYGVGEWPTYEIMSRCDVRSLWVGALIAVPSGAAVAIAVLAGNTASLVGVAISASLLPPAVNAGLLWAMSLVHLIFQNDDTRFTTVVKTQVYSDNPAIELAASGSISLLLTVVNIVCIFFAGILVFMIKEVAPSNSKVDQFFRNDMKANRDLNKILNGKTQDQSPIVNNDVMNLNGSGFEAALEQAVVWEAFRISQEEFLDRLKIVGNNHMTWSPAATINRRPSAHELHGRYRRLSEEPGFKKPRLSFPNSHVQNYSRLTEESSAPSESSIPNSATMSRKSSQCRPKFIITPVNDAMYKTQEKPNEVQKDHEA